MMRHNIVFVLCLLLLSATAWGQDTIRLLAIGNSFSEDAVEQHLYPIAAADSTVMIIGNLYIGGCDIDRHVSNIQHDAPAYSYRKIDTTGVLVTRDTTRLSYAIADEPWDFVSVQQASGLSGIAESYAQLPVLVEWVRSQAPQAQVIFHQTWAYARGSKHKDFARYDRDQDTMVCRILSASRMAADSVGIQLIVPSLRAITCARHRTPEGRITRDSYHLNRAYGRYIASATWYSALTGRSVVGNSYQPEGVTLEDLAWAQACATRALVPFSSLDDDTTYGSCSAMFPGGRGEFFHMMSKNLKYPQRAIEKGVQGRVEVSFIIERDGSMSHFEVKKDIGYGCGEAAIQALRKISGHRWIPAKRDGIPVRTQQTFPVTFNVR